MFIALSFTFQQHLLGLYLWRGNWKCNQEKKDSLSLRMIIQKKKKSTYSTFLHNERVIAKVHTVIHSVSHRLNREKEVERIERKCLHKGKNVLLLM